MQTMWRQLLQLDRSESKTLQVQIREKIVEAILNGLIKPMQTMPSSRVLAKELGLARNTIILAYEQLETDGYLKVIERKGYFVNDDIHCGAVNQNKSYEIESAEKPDWFDSKIVKRPALKSYIIKCKNWRDHKYPFVVGQLDPNLIPINSWRESVKQSLSVQEIKRWNADFIDADDPVLINEIQEKVLPRRGIWTKKENILLTAGAQNAMYLIASLLIDKNKTVGLENPGYPDIRNILSLKTRKITSIEIDGEGLIPTSINPRSDLIYTTPSHQYPTGVTMSMARRHELLAQADKKNFIIIEDDYEAETNFTDNPSPSLKSLGSDRVLYIGSFSKIFAPGLRLGYMVAPQAIIKEARALRRLMIRHLPTNNQRAVALFISLGHYYAMFNKIHDVYKTRWHVLEQAIAKQPLLSCVPTLGGSSFWVKVPKQINTRQLCIILRKNSTVIEPGESFFLEKKPPTNYLRLGYSSIETSKIEKGVQIIGDTVNKLMRE